MQRIIFANMVVVTSSFLVTLLLCLPEHIAKDIYPFSIIFFIASFAALVALVVTVIWAIPMHLILSKYKLKSYGWYLLLAIIPSFIFIYCFKPFGNDKATDLAMQAVICSFIGSVGAFLFWYILVCKHRITKLK